MSQNNNQGGNGKSNALLWLALLGTVGFTIWKQKIVSFFNKNKKDNESTDTESTQTDSWKVNNNKSDKDETEKKEISYPSLENIAFEDIPNLDKDKYITNFKFEDWDLNRPSINSVEMSTDSPYTKAAAEAWDRSVSLSFRKWNSFFVTSNTYNEETQVGLDNKFEKFVRMFVS